MGMFDTIIIEGLKLKAPKEVTSFLKENSAEFPSEFQTKDLFCALSTYKIKENGAVYLEERKPTGKKIPYKEPFNNWKDKRSLLEKLYWYFKNKKYNAYSKRRFVDETKSVFVKHKLTNTFTMLSYDEIGGRYLTLDYEIKAVDGKVENARLLKWSLETEREASKRHKLDNEFKQKMESSFSKRNEFQSKWYYPILRETYNPFIFFLRIAVQKICNTLVRWSYRWTGV